MTKPLNTALQEDEIDTLDSFLDSVEGPITNFEALDGMMCALACVPRPVKHSLFIDVVLEGSDFAEPEDVKNIQKLIIRHWNTVQSVLEKSSKLDEVYVPALIVDEHGKPMGNDWALGFMVGTSLTPDQWQTFQEDKDLQKLLMPMFYFAYEQNPDPNWAAPPLFGHERDEMLDDMFDNLMVLYVYFR